MRITSPETITKWNQIISKQQNSGLTILAFYKQNNLSTFCFHKWKQRLNSNKPIQKSNAILSEITEEVVNFIDTTHSADAISSDEGKKLDLRSVKDL